MEDPCGDVLDRPDHRRWRGIFVGVERLRPGSVELDDHHEHHNTTEHDVPFAGVYGRLLTGVRGSRQPCDVTREAKRVLIRIEVVA
jgi:hypothetical protein